MAHLRGLTATPSGGDIAISAEAYLAQLLTTDPDLPVVITGHSLGACLATVMALLVKQQNAGASVYPNLFAPPTAGDPAFAGLFATTFAAGTATNGFAWWNTLDLVPNAFQHGKNEGGQTYPAPNLEVASGLWRAEKGPGNLALAGVIATLQGELPQYQHVFLSAGDGGIVGNNFDMSLPGAVGTEAQVASFLNAMNPPSKLDPTSWLAQLMYQHFPPVYTTLIAPIAGIAPYDNMA